VKHTHKTISERSEPWFEINSSEIIGKELINSKVILTCQRIDRIEKCWDCKFANRNSDKLSCIPRFFNTNDERSCVVCDKLIEYEDSWKDSRINEVREICNSKECLEKLTNNKSLRNKLRKRCMRCGYYSHMYQDCKTRVHKCGSKLRCKKFTFT
jgi:hypothetical protein